MYRYTTDQISPNSDQDCDPHYKNGDFEQQTDLKRRRTKIVPFGLRINEKSKRFFFFALWS